MKRWSLVAAVVGFAAVLYAATAPSNDLGSEKPYGIASSTYTNTSAGTTVNGSVCFTTGPAVAPTVSGSYGACPAGAGADQTSALSDLNSAAQNCTVIGSGPLEGISIGGGTPGTFPPGCYQRAGALDISVNGIVTLNGAGVYIFKSTSGALTTGANSQVVMTGSACSNNVFWAPVGATTLGASSTFIGNILDAAGITLGLNANLTGRALAFGGTVTTSGNTITVPADCPALVTHLIINKTVVNSSGGVLTAAAFSGTITGAVVATGGNTWTGASTDRILTTVGAYNVTETAQAGYTATFSAGCSGTIAVGETRTCTVTNTDTATHLIINKTVVNSSGGVLTAAAFSGTITGAVVATGGNTWTGASTDRILTTVGAYNVTETAQAGYTAAFSAGCSGTIAAGETRTCTVTNTDTATHLIINKVVVNRINGGVLTPAAFSGTITGAVVATGGNTWAGASTDRTLTTAGAYNVTETAQAGYTATFSAGCSGTIAAGETRTCTVTNTDTAAHLIINKVVVNNSGGVLTPAAFSGTIGGAVVATGGNTWAGASTDRVLTTVGAYTVAETAQAGYAATLSAGCSGTIAAGETITCTITNDDIAGVPTLPEAFGIILGLGLLGIGIAQVRSRTRRQVIK